ncbi:plasmid partitioning/stability family protein [Erwinia sp. INIA-01]|uniref:plasmid partitioning/stability family protein n=1 Tax=Erwinia sp. INIA01 TaxID=2991500 RepID=UPI0022245DFE|nr:plasmid partitioning/stability family protein [Erwinia sp. INIA01]MCW1877212.1 plasmid partitioning/stability family protein [Erwinia sp. INIA01]
MDNRRKILFYINPVNTQADRFASAALDAVPQGERGRLQRASMLAGLALHKIDPRLPFLLSELLTETTSHDEIMQVISVVLPKGAVTPASATEQPGSSGSIADDKGSKDAADDDEITRKNAQAMFGKKPSQ